MGKDWDKLDAGLPQENVWKGRRGHGGASVGNDDSKPGSRHHVAYGGKRSGFKRCAKCGKRAFSGSPCRCDEPEWVIEYPDGPPSSVVRMQRWHETWLREAFRVLKPGGVLMAFGGTRTWHRLACAIEDAGFVLFDSILHVGGEPEPGVYAWVFGQGFPKHKTLLKPSFEPILCAKKPGAGGLRTAAGRLDSPVLASDKRRSSPGGPGALNVYADGYDENERPNQRDDSTRHNVAGRWPSNVCLSHLPECVAAGVRRVKGDARSGQAKGSGGLFLERGVPYDGRPAGPLYGDADGLETVPAYRCAPGCAVAELDRQSGERAGGSPVKGSEPSRSGYSGGWGRVPADGYPDTGGASRFVKTCAWEPGEAEAAARFFYAPKADRAERDKGLAGMPATTGRKTHGAGLSNSVNPCPIHGKGKPSGARHYACGCPVVFEGDGDLSPHRNTHPCVKPLSLMQWIVRLAASPGDTILDPFLGSGTTLIAADREGVNGVGIEQDAEYARIAELRIRGDAPLFAQVITG